jgi:hypothetical protein
VIIAECRLLNQNPKLRQRIFDSQIEYLKPRAIVTAKDESVKDAFADLTKIMKGVDFRA